MELGNLCFGHSRGEYRVSRNYENMIYQLLEELGEDVSHGWFAEFKNDVFEIRPYVWCDCDWGDEDPNCPHHLPNFLYKPTGYELRWYKHPLRDSYANQKLSHSEFSQMIEACIASLGKSNE